MQTEMLREKLEPEKKGGKYADPLMEFLNSDNQTLVYTCASAREADVCATSIRALIKKRKLNVVFWKKNYQIYVIKA